MKFEGHLLCSMRRGALTMGVSLALAAGMSPFVVAQQADTPGVNGPTGVDTVLAPTGEPAATGVFAATGADSEPALNPQEVFDDLPTTRNLAASLSDAESRQDTLLTLVAVARLIEYGANLDQGSYNSLEERFRDERAWLDQLTSRFDALPPGAPIFDPAAWFISLELDQHDLAPGPRVSPLGPDTSTLLAQVFDRADEALAAAVLPSLLPRFEIRSTPLWLALLDQMMSNEELLKTVAALNQDWFDSWVAAEPPAPRADSGDVIDQGIDSLTAIASNYLLAGPPDELRLKRLRFELLGALPGLPPDQEREAQYLLLLASAIDGLGEGLFLDFTESLLWVASDMLVSGPTPAASSTPVPVDAELETESPDGSAVDIESGEGGDPSAETEPELAVDQTRIPRLMAELLPQLSNSFDREFSRVDPRINSALATAFDVSQYLQSGQWDPSRIDDLRLGVADAVAQMVLLIPDMAYYFDQPVRGRISEEINICTSIAANRDASGAAKFSKQQFDGCLRSLVSLAGSAVNSRELSGDPRGPFGSEQLTRELVLAPWQRINFTLGYLHRQYPTSCSLPDTPLPNPLEWSALANMVAWFADQSPVYLKTPENEELLLELRQQGMNLLEDLHDQVDCISGSGSGINDPVARSLGSYRLALDELVMGLRQAELEFREQRLKAGADIMLHGDAGQDTAFRSDNLVIRPCDAERVCQMNGDLETTRALVGLFPDRYLIADQSGLGEIEICYDNVKWVNRRSEFVREDDPYVANYFGRLSFDLVGRYLENGEATPVFGSTFVSPDEYHYLFAAATEEVLSDECPTEWVGTRIVTELNTKRQIRVVPNRLTYLAGAREVPTQVITQNWSRGAEWRDRFVTGLGVTPHVYEEDPGMVDRVNRHLQSLYQAEQSHLYNALLRPRSRGGDENDTLIALLNQLSIQKALIRTQLSLFYPQALLDSDGIRASVEGHASLLDRQVIRRFREGKVAVESINEAGVARLESFQALWNRQPEATRRSGSVSPGLAHSLARLNSLYQQHFGFTTPPVESLPAPELLPEPDPDQQPAATPAAADASEVATDQQSLASG